VQHHELKIHGYLVPGDHNPKWVGGFDILAVTTFSANLNQALQMFKRVIRLFTKTL
jgi:hypothetical protein